MTEHKLSSHYLFHIMYSFRKFNVCDLTILINNNIKYETKLATSNHRKYSLLFIVHSFRRKNDDKFTHQTDCIL